MYGIEPSAVLTKPPNRPKVESYLRHLQNPIFQFIAFVVDFLVFRSYREVPGGTRDQHNGAAGVCNLRLTVCDTLL